MTDCSNRCDRQGTLDPQSVPGKQIDRHQARNGGAANIHRDDCAGPVHHERDHIAHPVELDLLAGQHPLAGRSPDRNIEIAAQQRAKQQKEHDAGTHAEAQVRVAQNAELDQREDDDEDADEDCKERRTERQIMELTQLHRSLTPYPATWQMVPLVPKAMAARLASRGRP